MRGISGLSSMIRKYAEHRDGRIGWWSHLYLFLDSAGRRKRLLNWKKEPFEERVDAVTGRKCALFKGRGAQCFHPDKWKSLFPYWSNEAKRAYFIVPAKECKCCEFHIPAKPFGRKRYAACRWFRENNNLDSPLQIYVKSVTQAQEMLK